MEKKEKNPVGRPSKYDPKYCQEIVDFFSIEPYFIDEVGKKVVNDLPMLVAFARKIGVAHDTLHEWVKVHPDFSVAYKQAKDLQERFVVLNALKGNFDSRFSIFTLKNISGWREKTEITGSDGGPLTIEIVKFDDEIKK